MSRSLYVLGGLAAMLLVVFAQFVVSAPAPAPQAASAVAAPAFPSAIDDLAAWPVAASR